MKNKETDLAAEHESTLKRLKHMRHKSECPQCGEMYTQKVIKEYYIKKKVSDTDFSFHITIYQCISCRCLEKTYSRINNHE